MVKIGVIGCGKIAQTRHLPEYATNPHAKLVGYYDKIRERSVQMAELYGGKAINKFIIFNEVKGLLKAQYLMWYKL